MRATSQLVSCFARANARKTLDKFFHLCDRKIRQELESGAGSTRSTRTDHAIESDATLHWWTGLLTGAVTNAGEAVRPNLICTYSGRWTDDLARADSRL